MYFPGTIETYWLEAAPSALEACAALTPRRSASGFGDILSSSSVTGGRVVRRHLASPQGSRLVRLFIPAGRPRGLVLMLHGCRQTAEDFARTTRFDRAASRHGLILAYPNQSRTQNPLGCWQWFRRSNQRRGSGEPALMAALVRHLIHTHRLDPSRVFAAGLSAGGAMAATLGTLYPELFAAVGIHSGVPFGVARDVASAYAAMTGEGGEARIPLRRPAIVFHGTADETVHVSNAERLMRSLSAGPAGACRYRLDSRTAEGRRYHRSVLECVGVADRSELWLVEGAGHAWSGGAAGESYADPSGPDSSSEMVRFFLDRAAARSADGPAGAAPIAARHAA